VGQTHAPQYYNIFYRINKYNNKRNKTVKFFRSNGHGYCPAELRISTDVIGARYYIGSLYH